MQDVPGARYGIDGKGIPNLLDPGTMAKMGAGTGLQIAKGIMGSQSPAGQAVEKLQTQLGYGDTLRETAQGLYEQAKREGWLALDTPAGVDPVQHAMDTVNQLTWSGLGNDPKTGPQAAAIRRVLAGENPEAVVRGAQQPEATAYADEWARWNDALTRHVEASGRLAYADGLAAWKANPQVGFMPDGTRLTAEQYANAAAISARKDAAQRATGTRQIGSEQDVLKELVLNVVYDPLSALNVGEVVPKLGAVFGKAKGTAQAAGLAADAVLDVETAAAEVAAVQALPKVISRAEEGVRLIDELIGKRDSKTGQLLEGEKPHPGFQNAVGATWLPGAQFIPGTDAAGFMSRFDQIKGASFLEAFESLKGGGAITEKEGAKGTDAINRMSTSTDEKEFIRAALDLQDVIRKGVENAQKRARRAARLD
jgi:hypothetical protein